MYKPEACPVRQSAGQAVSSGSLGSALRLSERVQDAGSHRPRQPYTGSSTAAVKPGYDLTGWHHRPR